MQRAVINALGTVHVEMSVDKKLRLGTDVEIGTAKRASIDYALLNIGPKQDSRIHAVWRFLIF